MDRRIFLGAAGSAAIAGPAAAQLFGRGASAPAAVAMSSREDGLAQAGSLFARVGRTTLAPNSRIIAPFFNLEIVEEVSGASRNRQSGGGSASSNFSVSGLDDAFTQSLVDRIYPIILADLTAAGYQIMPRQEALADPNYAGLVAIEKPTRFQDKTVDGGKSKFFAPSGMGNYFTYEDTRFQVSIGSAFAAMGAAGQAIAGAGQVSAGVSRAGQALNEQRTIAALNTTLMGIEMAARFVSVTTSGGGQYSNLFGSGTASVRGSSSFEFIAARTRVWFMPNPVPRDGRQYLQVNRAIKPTNNPIASVDDVTSRAQKAGDAAGLAVGALLALGGYGSNIGGSSTKSFQINLDPAIYPVALDGCVSGIAAAMVKQLGMPGATR